MDHSIWLAGAAPDGLPSRTLTDRVANGAEPSLPQCRERSGYEPSAPIEPSLAGGLHFTPHRRSLNATNRPETLDAGSHYTGHPDV